MQNSDEIGEQPVGTERGFLVEQRELYITAIGLLLAESLELTIAMMFAEELAIGDEVIAAETEQPDIALPCPLQHGFKRQRHATAMFVGSPRILALCIAQHLTDGALTAGHIPYRACHLVQDHRRLHFGGLCQCLELQTTAIDHSKQAVGTRFATKEHAIEAHPLSTCQRGGFHILRTLDERDVDVLQLTIPTTILEG